MMQSTEGEDGVSDRISELPDSIIYAILGLMGSTRDVVRTQLLSKNWKRVFDSYQTFDFDGSWFELHWMKDPLEGWIERPKIFKEYVKQSLATRLDRLECIEKFRLHVKGHPDIQCVAGWISAAIAKKVKELDVGLEYYRDGELAIDLTRSSFITRLKIEGDPSLSLAAMKMCNLREISIIYVGLFDEKAMTKLEENCPLLEDIKLVHCLNLSHLQISSLDKLKRVVLKFCRNVKYIKIASPDLKTLKLFDTSNIDRPGLECSNNLRNLSLHCYQLSDSEFERISMFPMLENLGLKSCYFRSKLRICSPTLKSFNLKYCSNLESVEVDAPNLHRFMYEGYMMPFPFFDSPRLSEAMFFLDGTGDPREHFFWKLDGSKGFKLLLITAQNMKIVEDAREEDLYQDQLEDCSIVLSKSSSLVVERIEDWLRKFRGKTIVVVTSTCELLKLINKLIIERRDEYPRRYFKGVKISSKVDGEKRYHIFRWRYRKTKSSSEKQ